MEYLTAIEAAKKWKISSRMVAYYCEAGRVEGAIKMGKTWLVPIHASKPVDKRYSKKKTQLSGSPAQENFSDSFKKENFDGNYSTGEVYNFLGFTRETLRYYEEIGLISPKRDEDNRYREFGFFDLEHLMAIDFYRKRGFSPTVIKDLLQTKVLQEYEEILQTQVDSLQSEMERLNGMLLNLKKARDFYQFTTQNNGKFEIRTMPSYYVKESIRSVASFQEYSEKVLKHLNLDTEDVLSNMVRTVTFDDNGFKTSGMYIVNPIPNEKGIDKTRILEGGKCLYTTLIVDFNDDGTIWEKMFMLGKQWISDYQVSFCGVVYIFIRFVMLGEKADKGYYEVWIPVR